MTTNFFQNIASLNLPGTWRFVIETDAIGNFTVSEIFSQSCGDNAANIIIPLSLNGSAQDLDEGFFDQITEPAIKTAALQSNLEAHLKSMEQAKAASKMEQDKKTKDAKAISVKKDNDHEMPEPKADTKKAYEEALRQISNLNDACKYEEALMLLPSVADYPEKETELKNKRADLNRKSELMAQARLTLNS